MTVTIGMLRQFSKPNQLVLAAAHAAKMIDCNFFFFHPTDVNFESRKIMGLFYEDGEWVRRETEFPDVVDNSPSRREYRETFNRLSKEVPFTMRRIGNKDVVNNRIKQDAVFAKYIIPSNKITSVEDILAFLKEYDAIVVKPAGGNRGKGIHFIAKTEEGFILNVDSVTKEIKREEMQDHLAPLIKRSMIVQPFIQSVTKEGLPFDIRLHVRRGMEGKWKTVKIYPRIGNGDGIVSNLSQGGSIGRIRPFLKHQFGEKWLTIWKELNELASAFPNYFQKSYDEPLDALGLDIGIDSDGRLWLFEVNSFPGSTMFELEAQQVAMQYAKHLALIHKKDLLKVDALKKGIHTNSKEVDKEDSSVSVLEKQNHEMKGKPVIAMLSPAKGRSRLKFDCAAVSPFYEAEFFYFTVHDIDYEKQVVQGQTHEDGKWITKIYRREEIDVIYDRLRAIGRPRFKKAYDFLKGIPNTHPIFGRSINKLEVYDKISNEESLKAHIIPYENFENVEKALNFIAEHTEIILKPHVGHGGKSLVYIIKEDDTFILHQQFEKKTLDHFTFMEWLEEYTSTEDFLLQKYINTRTIDGNPFDIRAHMMRDKTGKWSYVAYFPRIGVEHEKITQQDRGGYRGKWKGFLERNYGKEKYVEINKQFKRIVPQLLSVFEREYNQKISEAGLDLAISPDGQIYLIEFNILRPGIHYYEFEVAKRAIGYALYLHETQEKKKVIDEKVKKMTIGMWSPSSNADRMALACASICSLKGQEYFYFTTKGIDLENSIIRGKTYKYGGWVVKEYDINNDIDAIYDRLRHIGRKSYKPYYEKLSHIPMTHESFGDPINKLGVLKRFKAIESVQDWMLPFDEYSFDTLVTFLSEYKTVILKPRVGNFGRGLYWITKENDTYSIIQKDNVWMIKGQRELLSWCEEHVGKARYLIQQYVSSRTQQNDPFDVRVHVARNKENEWDFVSVYPRIGVEKEKITAMKFGGYIGQWEGFINFQFGKEFFDKINEEMKKATLEILNQFEKSYGKKLTEAGLDFLITSEGNLAFLEINVKKPGVAGYDFDLAKTMLGYAAYLYREKLMKIHLD